MRKYTYNTVTWVFGTPLDAILNEYGKHGWRFVQLDKVAAVPIRKKEGFGYEEVTPGTPLGYIIFERVTTE